MLWGCTTHSLGGDWNWLQFPAKLKRHPSLHNFYSHLWLPPYTGTNRILPGLLRQPDSMLREKVSVPVGRPLRETSLRSLPVGL